MDIEKLAEMTAKEFGVVHEKFSAIDRQFDGVNKRLDRLESGQKAILEAVLEIPTKKVFEKLVRRVDDIDERVGVVERKLQPAH